MNGGQVGPEVKTIKHTRCQIDVINKAERQSIPGCDVRCDRQVRANASESISGPLALGLGQAATERKPFHNEEKRKLARKKPQKSGGRGEKGSCGERNALGGEVIGAVGL